MRHLVLGLWLVSMLLCGCVHKDPDAVVVWSWDIAAQALRDRIPGFYAAHPEYRRYPIQVLDLGHQAVVDRGMAGLAAGGVNLPDVYCVENNAAEAFWSRFPASFVDLGPLGADALTDRYPPFKWAELKSHGHTLALPWDSGPVVLFYRRDFFTQAGIDPTRLDTWDDFARAGQRILAWSHGHIKLATMANGIDDDWFRLLLNQGGGSYFNDDATRVTVAEAPGVQALRTIRHLADLHVLAYGGWGDQVQLLHGGVAAALYGAWYEGTIRTECPEESGQWGVLRMPAFETGGSHAANIGGSALAIPITSRHQDVAWAFMRYSLAETDSQVAMLREKGLVPSYIDALQDPWIAKPQPYWGNQAIWPLVLGTLKDIRPNHSSEYFQDARQIVTSVQADYLEERYPSAEAALQDAARLIREATNLESPPAPPRENLISPPPPPRGSP